MIHAAGVAALRTGVRVDDALGVVRDIAERVPVIVMCYANIILARGLERFADTLLAVGASGLIVPDLPLEEAPAVMRQRATVSAKDGSDRLNDPVGLNPGDELLDRDDQRRVADDPRLAVDELRQPAERAQVVLGAPLRDVALDLREIPRSHPRSGCFSRSTGRRCKAASGPSRCCRGSSTTGSARWRPCSPPWGRARRPLGSMPGWLSR